MKICEADFDRMMCDPTREILNGLMDCPTCISRTWSILMGPSRSSSRRAPQMQICPESRLQQAWKLAVALTSGEWRSLLQPENMEKDASEKSIEIKDTLTDASPFLSHVLQEEKPSFSGLNRAITTASVKAVWAGCVGSCGEKHKELSKTVSIYIANVRRRSQQFVLKPGPRLWVSKFVGNFFTNLPWLPKESRRRKLYEVGMMANRKTLDAQFLIEANGAMVISFVALDQVVVVHIFATKVGRRNCKLWLHGLAGLKAGHLVPCYTGIHKTCRMILRNSKSD